MFREVGAERRVDYLWWVEVPLGLGSQEQLPMLSEQAGHVQSIFHGYPQHRTCGLNKSFRRMQLRCHPWQPFPDSTRGKRFMSSGYVFTR